MIPYNSAGVDEEKMAGEPIKGALSGNAQKQPVRKIKILIVDQDPIIARDIKETLHNLGLGYTVTSIVSTGEDALQKVKQDTPDLLLLGIALPGKFNGIETGRRIRALYDIPIIYVTTHSDEKTLQKAKLVEPDGYVLKPIDERELRIAIEIALRTHAKVKKTEKALRESERRFRQLLENMSEAVIVLDEKGMVTYVNSKLLEKSGYRREDILGYPPQDFFIKEQVPHFKKQFARRKKGLSDEYEIEVKLKNGSKAPLYISSAPIHDDEGNFKGSIAVLTDITERRRFEEELKRSQEDLRKLSRHLHFVRERESKRISREIHDELGQALTALKMELTWISNNLPLTHELHRLVSNKAKSMSSLVDSTIKKVQRIASELRPGVLDDLGLVPAIEWLGQDFQNRTKIKCLTNLASFDYELDPECSTAVFRILQEALTNVTRHARASRVRVSLKEKKAKLGLKIRDNGRGIADKDVLSPDSLGLVGMRERLRPFQGDVRIQGIPDKGTTLAINLPINRIRKR
jgi:PAS domain S-box-containing protein